MLADLAGQILGKEGATLSSTLSLPSLTAKPTAVEVKLLLMEYSVCRSPARKAPTSLPQ